MLESWRDSRYGVFEVKDAHAGVVTLTDLLAGDTVAVGETDAAGELHLGDLILARLETYRGSVAFSETPIQFQADELPALRSFIDTEVKTTGQTPAEFAQANSHRLHRVFEDL